MHAGGAVDKDLAFGIVKSLAGKFHAGGEQFRGLRLKVVVGGAVEYSDRVRGSQGPVVKLNLHVDDMGHALPDEFSHVLVIPYPAANGNAVRHPGDVHMLDS